MKLNGLFCNEIFLQVASFPFDDHNCPPIQLITLFCQSAYSWLKEDIENVVVVHCKAGMARTGLMISSLLLYLKVKMLMMWSRKSNGGYCGNFCFLLAFLVYWFIRIFHLSSVLSNCWGVYGLLQPEKMYWWKRPGSSKSDCKYNFPYDNLEELHIHSWNVLTSFTNTNLISKFRSSGLVEVCQILWTCFNVLQWRNSTWTQVYFWFHGFNVLLYSSFLSV